MKVLLLGEIGSGKIGGGESVIVGLVKGLSALPANGDTYTLLCPHSLADQLRGYLAPHIQLISRPNPKLTFGNICKNAFGSYRKPLGHLWRKITGKLPQELPATLPTIDPFIRSLSYDVIHFILPLHYATGSTCAVFSLNDLQHEHLPEIFGAAHIAYRRMLYDTVRSECAAIVAISQFTALDFQKHHQCDPAQLYVVPLAPYVGDEQPYDLSDKDQQKLEQLPPDFILYPAYSYRHKNHRVLLDALSLIESEYGLRIPLICTGGRSEEWVGIINHLKSLTPVPQMVDLVYTSSAFLQRLYERARFVVFPTLFEGAGLPLMEAARCGTAVACSDIPPFREFGGDGPIYFDPYSQQDMAKKIVNLWNDEKLRERTASRTKETTINLTWEKTALAMRAIYRKVAGMPPLVDDRNLLQECQFIKK